MEHCEGPGLVIDGWGDCYTIHAAIDVDADGAWSGVLTGPLPWIQLQRRRLTVELLPPAPATPAFRGHADIVLIVGTTQAAVRGQGQFLIPAAPAHLPAVREASG